MPGLCRCARASRSRGERGLLSHSRVSHLHVFFLRFFSIIGYYQTLISFRVLYHRPLLFICFMYKTVSFSVIEKGRNWENSCGLKLSSDRSELLHSRVLPFPFFLINLNSFQSSVILYPKPNILTCLYVYGRAFAKYKH